MYSLFLVGFAYKFMYSLFLVGLAYLRIQVPQDVKPGSTIQISVPSADLTTSAQGLDHGLGQECQRQEQQQSMTTEELPSEVCAEIEENI
jgi:hypothetical protein